MPVTLAPEGSVAIPASVVGSSLVEMSVNTADPAPSASNIELPASVNVPRRFWLVRTSTDGGPAVLVTLILLKLVTALPLILCFEVPLNTTVPVPWLNVPLFVKLRVRFSVAGALSIPDIVIFAKSVADVPAIEVDPLKTTVPPLRLNVPLLVKFPATFMLPVGAVSVLAVLITMLLKELVLRPEMDVVPPKVVVAEPAIKVPSLTRFPSILILIVGVSVPVTVTEPNCTGDPPLMDVVPLKVTGLEVSVETAFATKFPFMFIPNVPALNTPFDKVRSPLMVSAWLRVSCAPPVLVTCLNADADAGISEPVEMSDAIL